MSIICKQCDNEVEILESDFQFCPFCGIKLLESPNPDDPRPLAELFNEEQSRLYRQNKVHNYIEKYSQIAIGSFSIFSICLSLIFNVKPSLIPFPGSNLALLIYIVLGLGANLYFKFYILPRRANKLFPEA